MQHFIWVFTICQTTMPHYAAFHLGPHYLPNNNATLCSISSRSSLFAKQQCHIMQHFIWVFTICQTTMPQYAAFHLGLHYLPNNNATLCSISSGSSLFAKQQCHIMQHCIWVFTICQTTMPHFAAFIWVFTVCQTTMLDYAAFHLGLHYLPNNNATLCSISSGSSLFAKQQCHIMQHFIWVFTICQTTILHYAAFHLVLHYLPNNNATLCSISSGSSLFAKQHCHIVQHFIWVFTICQTTHLGISRMQRVKYYDYFLQKNDLWT